RARAKGAAPYSATAPAPEDSEERRKDHQDGGEGRQLDGRVGPGHRVSDEEKGPIQRASDQPPPGALPAISVLEAGEDGADKSHRLNRPVSGSGDPQDDAGDGAKHGGNHDRGNDLDLARPLVVEGHLRKR